MEVRILREKGYTNLEEFLGISVKWMIDQCGECSWVRWKWGIWEFSFKGSVRAVGTTGWG